VQRGGAKEIGTLRFGWLAEVAGRGWGLPRVTPARMRLLGMMNLKLFNSSFLVNSMISGLTCDANDLVCVDSCCELRGRSMTMFRWPKQRRAFTQQPTPGRYSYSKTISLRPAEYPPPSLQERDSSIDPQHVEPPWRSWRRVSLRTKTPHLAACARHPAANLEPNPIDCPRLDGCSLVPNVVDGDL
jgi:hypothetical protein